MLRPLIIGCTLSVAVAGSAAAQDAANGEKLFKRCAACHVVNAPTNRVGPSLQGVFGRTAGSVEGFKYSEAMKAKGQEGLVWNAETIGAYLENPKAYIPKNKMAFPGLKKPEERADVIAYLESATATQ
jgi:cytochrome c